MSLAVDEIKLAVMINVVAEDGEAGVAEVPISMPLPLVVICIDLLKPAVSCEHVRLAITVDVGDTNAVTILLAASQVVHPRLVFTKIDPENTCSVVVGESEIRLAVAVDISEGAALGIVAVSDFLGLPHGAGGDGLGPGVAIPPEAVRDPAGGDEIGQTVVIDVDDPFSAVGDELVVYADGAKLMLLPLATICAGILVPVSAAEQIQKTVAIHVEHGDTFGMVGAETMGKKGNARLAAGAVTRVLHAELSGMSGILCMTRTEGKK